MAKNPNLKKVLTNRDLYLITYSHPVITGFGESCHRASPFEPSELNKAVESVVLVPKFSQVDILYYKANKNFERITKYASIYIHGQYWLTNWTESFIDNTPENIRLTKEIDILEASIKHKREIITKKLDLIQRNYEQL